MCEKCQDRGFTEENHGLVIVLCDCDKAREVAEKNGIPWRKDDSSGTERDNPALPEITSEQRDLIQAVHIALDYGEINDDTGDSGNRPDNQPIGSANSSESKQLSKPKKKKKARTRTS